MADVPPECLRLSRQSAQGDQQRWGFCTGDIVRAIVPSSSLKAGIYVGCIAIRATGSGTIKTVQETVQGIHSKYCQPQHRGDGYAYQKGAVALPPHV